MKIGDWPTGILGEDRSRDYFDRYLGVQEGTVSGSAVER